MKKLTILFLFLFGCNSIPDPNEVKSSDSYTFKKICIEGHVYYRCHKGYQGYLSSKLDDNGNPVKCKMEK